MSKLKDDLYQRFNGFKPVKTSKGEWYYNDPRFDEDNPNNKIKVANENSPNPKIDEILEDDMNNNPEDYYIWRTKDDDKVRSSHAARDGKIFNYNVPPEGGNPGEDYNCRCWAEPYHPNKNKQSDVAKVDLSGLPQYVGNISDDELLEKMWKNIKEFEGYENFPYLDTKGKITIGAGANVSNWNVFKQLNVTFNNIPATEMQKWNAYKHMLKLSEEKDSQGNYVNRNRKAKTFKSETNLWLSDKDVYNMAKKHMISDLAHLRREFPDFDDFPIELKEVLLDIQYNVIGGVNENNWPKLYKAIKEKNVLGKDGIVEHVNRPDVGKDRNDWAKRMVGSIRF